MLLVPLGSRERPGWCLPGLSPVHWALLHLYYSVSDYAETCFRVHLCRLASGSVDRQARGALLMTVGLSGSWLRWVLHSSSSPVRSSCPSPSACLYQRGLTVGTQCLFCCSGCTIVAMGSDQVGSNALSVCFCGPLPNFRASRDAPDSSCIVPAPALESARSPRSPGSFHWRWHLDPGL